MRIEPWLDESIAANGRQVKHNFAVWFGGSKGVDSEGRPLVVYHGATADIAAFDKELIGGESRNEFGAGFYFTPNASGASLYAGGTGSNVLAVYLSIKNPKFVTTNDRGGATGWQGEHDGLIVVYADATDKAAPHNWAEVVARDPGQIKSAIGNSGLYLPDSSSLVDLDAALALQAASKAKDYVACQWRNLSSGAESPQEQRTVAI